MTSSISRSSSLKSVSCAIMAVLAFAMLAGCSCPKAIEEPKPSKPQSWNDILRERLKAGETPRGHRLNSVLQWLADHQNPLGYWSPNDYLNDSIRTKGPSPAAITHNVDFRDHIARMHGNADNDKGIEAFRLGVTGLALLPFVGDGNTHNAGRFAPTVNLAARYIMSTQDAEGCFGSRDEDEYVYCHAICTMAIAELYEMTLSPAHKRRGQRAVDFIVRCQNPGLGWRYGVQPKENDSSVTAWMMLAMHSAKSAGLIADYENVYKGANAWYDLVTDANGKVGYDRPGGGNARMTTTLKYHSNAAMDACSLLTRIYTEQYTPDDPRAIALAKRVAEHPPTWYIDGDEKNGPYNIDMVYWFFGTNSLFQMGDAHYSPWTKSMHESTLVKYQRGYHPKDVARFGKAAMNPATLPDEVGDPNTGRWVLDEYGSWDPVGAWGSIGGRVYSTAMGALIQAMDYRR